MRGTIAINTLTELRAYLYGNIDCNEQLEECVLSVLEAKGYKVKRPPKDIADEYTFENAWNLYDKKVGNKADLKRRWNSLSKTDRKAATEYIPSYVLSQPDKKYRKNFQTFINQRGWEDEIIGLSAPEQASQPQQQSNINKLIEETKVKKASWREEFQDSVTKSRILGMIEYIKFNPKSICRGQLVEFYNSGTMKKLGIKWEP